MTVKPQIVPGTWGVRSSAYYLIGLLFTIVVIAVVYLTRETASGVLPIDQEHVPLDRESSRPSGLQVEEHHHVPVDAKSCSGLPVEELEHVPVDEDSLSEVPVEEFVSVDGSSPGDSSSKQCNLFDGKWVYDNKSYPLYKEKQCSFMPDQFACEKNGRKDLSYQNWRWQPHHCDLPRFNAVAILERLRDKRLVFVENSLNRQQWVSMVCLVDSIIPSNLKSMTFSFNGSLITFKAIEYNASIEFYWAPLLVESNSDHPVNHRVPERIVRVQAIEKHARRWTDADILIFNSYLWWRMPKMKVLWGSFEGPDRIYRDVEMPRCFEMALRTWADWLEVHVNHSKTQLFFVSMSPTHERAEDWGGDSGQNCYNETGLISKEGYMGSGSDPKMMQVVESTIDELKTRGVDVQILNITQLSEYRKEGHLSIYRRLWEPLTEDQISKPTSYADCFHWCLPGVPDIWNEIFYSYIFHL